MTFTCKEADSGRGVRIGFLGIFAFLGLLLASAPALAQVNTGRISGAVTDQSGGAVAGASVTIVDVARGESRPLVADSAGLYAAPNLTPGIYTVRAEFKGFQTVERQNIEVGVGSDVRVDISLQPGEQTQTITVTESLPIMNTTNAQTGETLENNVIMNLPMNGRNYRWTAALVPGVFMKPGEATASVSTNGTIAGDSVNYLIDGLYEQSMFQMESTVSGQSEAGDTTLLPLDAVQEINLIINPKAEYGWAPGVTYDIGLKSGTNDMHGDAYAFGRDQDLDGRNPFAATRTPVSFEQWGATLGGAIKKNKLFYFLGYESERVSSFSTFVVNSPTTADWVGSSGGCTQAGVAGNCTDSIPDAIADINAYIQNHPGTKVALNPLSLNLAGCNTTKITPAMLQGSLIAPFCSANQFGAPGLFNNAASSTTNVTNTFPNTGGSDNGLFKLDYRLNDRHSLNGSFFFGKYAELAVPNTQTMTQQYWAEWLGVNSDLARVAEIWTPNSAWLNEARVGWDHDSRPVSRVECTPNGDPWANPSGVGATGGFDGAPNYATQYGLVSGSPECGIPTTTISGFTGQLGFANNRVQFDNDYQGADTLSYTRGTHQFKFGTDIRAEQFIGAKVLDGQTGQVAFGAGGVAAFAQTTGSTTVSASALEDFLAGVPNSEGIRGGSNVRDITTDKIAAFAQDDWRVVSRVTLNLGVRWEMITPARDAHGLMGNFDPSAPSGMIQNNQIWKTQSNFSPHVGFAWDITGRGTTVLRAGGYAAYMIPMLMNYVAGSSGSTGEDWGSEPTAATLYFPNGTTLAGPGNITSGFVFRQPITSNGVATSLGTEVWAAGTPLFASVTPACGNGLPPNPPLCVATGGDPNINTGYTYYSWNLNVQHAFTNDLSLDVGYVGSHSSGIDEFFDINQPTTGVSGTSAEQARRPYNQAGAPAYFPWFSNIIWGGAVGNGNYAGLQMLLRERVTHGLTLQAAYTLSHGLAQGAVTNSSAPTLDYGSLGFDALHHLAVAATYALPGRKSPAQLLQGWGLNLAVSALSGLPINASDSRFDTTGTGNSAERWSIYGPASSLDRIIGGAGTVPCYSLTSGSFASSCIQVASGSGTKGTPGFVANFPSACVTAAEAGSVSNGGLWNVSSNSTVPTSNAGYNGLAQLATIGCYFYNGTAIVPPAQGTYGNMTFDQLRGKGITTVDASVTKDWKIKERFTAQFRFEVFNLLNHSEYASAQANLSSPTTFGAAKSTPDVATGSAVTGNGAPRDIQLGLKLSF